MIPSRDNLFAPPTQFQRIYASPLKYATRKAYRVLYHVCRLPRRDTISFACISDTHNNTHHVPDADYLIHAGDLTVSGTRDEMQEQINWLHDLPHKEKFVIAGNHDSCLDPTKDKQLSEGGAVLRWRSLTYLQSEKKTLLHESLQNNAVTQRKLTIFGSPWVPRCGGSNFAFQYARTVDQDALVWWNKTFQHREAEDGIKILMTHTPPKYFLDTTINGNNAGSKALLDELWSVRPSLHVCGHIHGARGVTVLRYDWGRRAYERASARSDIGFLELLNPWAWLDLMMVFACGVWVIGKSSFVWVVYIVGIWIPTIARLSRHFEYGKEETILVNAAMFYDQYGNPTLEPVVIKF